MRKATIYIVLLLMSVLSCSKTEEVQPVVEGVFINALNQRDSILIADQFEYGVHLQGLEDSTSVSVVEWTEDELGFVEPVTEWKVDTLASDAGLRDLRISRVITSFEEGEHLLPGITIAKIDKDGRADTLQFENDFLDFKTVQLDSTFVMHDIRGQISYPESFIDKIVRKYPWLIWVLAILLCTALIVGAVVYSIQFFVRKKEEALRKDPPHVVALRQLDGYRNRNLWVPEKQKLFYSGITYVLKDYIAARFGVAAMEMTTKEIITDLKKCDIPADLIEELRKLMETADYVKFAKYIATDEENVKALPVAVMFVTNTYQKEIEADETVKSE